MTSWFFSYWVGERPPRGNLGVAPGLYHSGGYFKTNPERYPTEGECIAAATAFRIRTGNKHIQIHKRGRGGRSASYKLGEGK